MSSPSSDAAPDQSKTASKPKPAVRPAAKPAVKPAAKKPAPRTKTAAAPKSPAAPAKVAKVAKPAEIKKPKLVRDSFTMPQIDHDMIKQCKKTAVATGRETKKSEVVRAAIRCFAALSMPQQLAAYAALQTIPLGRPKAK
jgi:hypothetical protein